MIFMSTKVVPCCVDREEKKEEQRITITNKYFPLLSFAYIN